MDRVSYNPTVDGISVPPEEVLPLGKIRNTHISYTLASERKALQVIENAMLSIGADKVPVKITRDSLIQESKLDLSFLHQSDDLIPEDYVETDVETKKVETVSANVEVKII